ncbi:MAG: hypothetical protein AAB546_01430 [Patescibacteria group bacterium]
MSLIFWDDYLELDDVYKHIGKISSSPDEKNELANVIDELVHHRLMGCILENLDKQHHEEFLFKFSSNPGDADLSEYLKQRIKNDFGQLVKLEVEKLKKEILSLFNRV